MRYLVVALTYLFLSSTVSAQKLHVGLFGGLSAYSGDLTEKILPKKNLHAAIGITGNYELADQFMLRAGLTYTKLGAHDKYNSDTTFTNRNLSFKTSLIEFNAVMEYYLLNLYNRKYSPYAFVGLAVYRFNPYTHTSAGEKVYLRPLSTEGQGLPGYTGRKEYSLTQLAIPFGGGIKFAINDNLRIGAEIGIRKLFTDYIDDVSTFYADATDLENARGPIAVELSYRGDELPDGNPLYPGKERQRGSAENKDYYGFGGIHLTYRLGGEKSGGGRGKKNGLGCPTNIY